MHRMRKPNSPDGAETHITVAGAPQAEELPAFLDEPRPTRLSPNTSIWELFEQLRRRCEEAERQERSAQEGSAG
jgi:hypothetical protein